MSDELKQYLENISRLHNQCGFPFSIESFIRANGTEFSPPPNDHGYKRGVIKECFANATKAIIRYPELIYAEGYAIGVIPVLHAWCVHRKTREVVEVTWEYGTAQAYFGIPFKRKFVLDKVFSQERYGLLDQPPNFDLIRGKIKKDVWYDEKTAKTEPATR